MEPNLPPLDVGEMLTWAAFAIRDILALLALAAAVAGMLVALVTLYRRGQARVDARSFQGGGLAWIFAALACLAPRDDGLLKLSRFGVVGILALSAAMWILVFVLRRYVRLKG